jgi:MYXO-CTERM domain-containing protein
LTLAPRASWANGRPAATTSLAFAPNPNRIIAGATFGAVVSNDSGTTWQLICEDPLGTAGIVADPVFRDSPTGLLLVGSIEGLLYSRDGGCSYTHGGGTIANQSVADIAVSPTNPMQVLAATNTVGGANGVQVSNDGGATWASLFALPSTSFRSVGFAADGRRAYALGVTSAAALLVYRSDDAGNSFTQIGSAAIGLSAPHLFGVSPTDNNTIYFSVMMSNNYALYRSTDAGATLQLIAAAIPAIYGGVMASDGSVFVATSGGVQKLPAGSTTLGPPPTGSPPVTCLGLHDGALLGCSTEDASGFALGRSTDDGQTWTPILRFSRDITGPLQCAASTDVCLQCYVKWPTFAMQFNISNATAPMCTQTGGDAEGSTPDGGNGASAAGTACSCSVGAAQESSPTAAPLIIVSLLLALRMRR